jgi:hypothetical protein
VILDEFQRFKHLLQGDSEEMPEATELAHHLFPGHEDLRRSLVLYRMVFGQNRQEDLVSCLATRLPTEAIPRLLDLCRVDLTPPEGNKDL